MSRPAEKSTDLKANLLKVLGEITKRVEEGGEEVHEEWAEALDDMLDTMKNSDAFGSEASSDPRGDFREGEFSMWEVQA